MKRREFLAGLLLQAAVCFARAQQPAKTYRIAIVHPSRPIAMLSEKGGTPFFAAFFEQLHRLGYIEGQNLLVDYYSGEGRTERYAELARDVVRSGPELIFTISVRMAQHFKATATTIPIVAFSADPVAFGLVQSLARPGGNITGVTPDVGMELWSKQLQFLKEAIPTAHKVAYLTPGEGWDNPLGAFMREAAKQIGIELIGALLKGPLQEAEYRRVFAVMAQERVDAVIVNDTPENATYQRLIAELAGNARLPTVCSNRSFVELGCLMAYGANLVDLYRRAADQIDLILKGVKPGEIPFYQATKFELTINLKTAKTLGLTIPQSLLVRADEVIQ